MPSEEICGNYSGDWIQTFTGKRFYVMDPKPEMVDIVDIAHALSLQCRFAGHSRYFYSVSEHCVRVSLACEPEDALWGLLHDASEAYLGDITRPLKRDDAMTGYRTAEGAVTRAICAKYGLNSAEPASVKVADNLLLLTEARDLMPDDDWWRDGPFLYGKIKPWTPYRAEKAYLKRFEELFK